MTHSEHGFESALHRAMHCSRYAQRLLTNHEDMQIWLREHYAQPCNAEEIGAWLDAMPVSDETSLSASLRTLRKRVMLKLLTRDLGGTATLDEVTGCMTALAELAIQRSQAFLMRELVSRHGFPIGSTSGQPQDMLVVGMGKLGGSELNVSSDIDLIFVYPEDGDSNGAHSISNHEFFGRLGRRLISLINEHTGDGFVFRVDMRLRPYGDSGPLVMSFAALEEYLVEQGREWERYAWIKARVVSPADNAALMALVQPFIYRKYLDFGAVESMRKLHAQIRQEVLRRDRLNNIKLGPGGIREIEFTAQVFQLIRGGRDASLHLRPTCQVLQLLARKQLLEPGQATALCAAYEFLRRLEHRLQYLDDQQTQDLPENPGDQALIAEAMGYGDYAAMIADLDQHRMRVSMQFSQIFSSQDSDDTESRIWHDGMKEEELCAALADLGYANTSALAGQLLHIRDSSRYRQLPDSSRQRMDKLVPQFITLCSRPENRDQTLLRILTLLEAISRRAAYLAFLAEYPRVLERLVKIASASGWASGYLIQHPILLDELLDAREIYQPPDWPGLDNALHGQLAHCADDAERQMDVLRQFQHVQIFHLLAMDLQGLLPLEKLSDHLSDLADLILRHALDLSWKSARKVHQPQAQFAIIGYGKLGGRELGYAADLDLIFLYDDPHPDAAEIYARLAQRINTLLSSYTSSGRLYETDLRLRPNGASGLLVSSIPAFSEYQSQHAWVWEHQALTRARFCAGDAGVGRQFEAIRDEVLRRPRNTQELRREILAMRQKMHDAHPNASGQFDIKHDRGGMVDIEFMVQFLVLAHAHHHPELTANSGNLALLRLAGELGLVDARTADILCGIYRALRALQHRIRLNSEGPCRIPPGQVDSMPVTALWNQLLQPEPR